MQCGILVWPLLIAWPAFATTVIEPSSPEHDLHTWRRCVSNAAMSQRQHLGCAAMLADLSQSRTATRHLANIRRRTPQVLDVDAEIAFAKADFARLQVVLREASDAGLDTPYLRSLRRYLFARAEVKQLGKDQPDPSLDRLARAAAQGDEASFSRLLSARLNKRLQSHGFTAGWFADAFTGLHVVSAEVTWRGQTPGNAREIHLDVWVDSPPSRMKPLYAQVLSTPETYGGAFPQFWQLLTKSEQRDYLSGLDTVRLYEVELVMVLRGRNWELHQISLDGVAPERALPEYMQLWRPKSRTAVSRHYAFLSVVGIAALLLGLVLWRRVSAYFTRPA